jgi:U3 small nucleolar RNA-associated protein 20
LLFVDLFKLLSDHKEGEANLNLRVPIAIAYAKLLTKLPSSVMHLELPRLLTTIVQILRSRSQEVRDAARETLFKIAIILGPRYFLFMVKELSGALKSGYQVHILGFSLHYLLSQVLPEFGAGAIDPSVPAIVEILLNDIFGEVAEEKEVDALASKMKECKAKKVYF